MSTMQQIYASFCTFGGSATALMDGARFAKFARDTKLLDKNLTPTDVDLIFTKVKNKNERRISYVQFEAALPMLAEKKFPALAPANALEIMKKKIFTSKGPTANGTKATNSGIVGKLTDTSRYTGAHKYRFLPDGTGRGKAGRDSIPKGNGKPTAYGQDGSSGYANGYKNAGTYKGNQL